MINSVSGFLWQISNFKTFLIALAVYVFFGAYIMPQGLNMMQEMAGKKVEVLDLQFAYTETEAKQILAEYPKDLLHKAAKFEMIADTLYPLSYTLLFVIALAWLFKVVSLYQPVYRFIHLSPFLMMGSDYCENIGIVTMLCTYPHFGKLLPTITSVFTTAKWWLLGLEVALIIYGLSLLFYYKVVKNT